MKTIYKYSILFISLILCSCGPYSFTGASIPPGAKTFQVNYFKNLAGNRPGSTVDPGLDLEITQELQDLLLNQTNLSLVKSKGDLIYEGEITEYSVTPMSATSQNTASQNRLTIVVNIRYINEVKEENSFEKRFSHFYDFSSNQQVFDVRDEAHQEILERITQDVFNASLAKW